MIKYERDKRLNLDQQRALEEVYLWATKEKDRKKAHPEDRDKAMALFIVITEWSLYKDADSMMDDLEKDLEERDENV